jgi:hypothetical protein
MGNPKFKIGDRLFYKGHIHCTIMDIIQENLSFTYEVNMSLNNKNKIVDEWELFEKKQNVFVDVETGLKKEVKQVDKVEKKRGRPKKNKFSSPPLPITFPNKDWGAIQQAEANEFSIYVKEVIELKKMIANLTELVLKQNKNVSKTKGEQSKRRSHLEDRINALKVGQKRTFFNYSMEKIQEVLTSPINNRNSFNVINFGKKSQIYRFK